MRSRKCSEIGRDGPSRHARVGRALRVRLSAGASAGHSIRRFEALAILAIAQATPGIAIVRSAVGLVMIGALPTVPVAAGRCHGRNVDPISIRRLRRPKSGDPRPAGARRASMTERVPEAVRTWAYLSTRSGRSTSVDPTATCALHTAYGACPSLHPRETFRRGSPESR